MDHVEHAVADAGAQVHRQEVGHGLQPLQRLEVAHGQIHHVDVVAHAGAVGGGVVVAPHIQKGPLPHGHLGHKRQQVVGNAARVFTDQPAFVRAHRVEVAQDADAPRRVAAVQVAQQVFHHQLATAIGVGGRERVVFGQRQALRVAVHRGRRAEHQRLHAAGIHGFEQAQCAHHVVVVITQRLRHRLAHRLQPRAVDHRRGTAGLQGRRQSRHIADVALDQPGLFARDALHPRQRLGLAVAKVVEYRHVQPCIEQFNAGMGANVASATGHKNHGKPLVVQGRHVRAIQSFLS